MKETGRMNSRLVGSPFIGAVDRQGERRTRSRTARPRTRRTKDTQIVAIGAMAPNNLAPAAKLRRFPPIANRRLERQW